LRELLEKFGLLQPLPELRAAEQVTIPAAQLRFGGVPRPRGSSESRKLRRDWRTLIKLAETPIASRAITLITDKVKALEYSIEPSPEHIDDSVDYSKQIDTVRRVLDNPNIDDGDWPTFVGQIVEDQLTFDMGVFEYVEKPTPAPVPNDILALIPIPGWCLERTELWAGDPTKPRWVQQGGPKPVPLLDSQIEAIIMRRRSSTAYGVSPLEVALSTMDAYLKLSNYQANVASDAYPAFLVSLGEAADQTMVDRFQNYWESTLTGRAKPGIFGGMGKPETLQLKALDDDGMYLKYWEILIRVFAFSFRLKAQDFNIERDVNRSQGEVSQAASIEESVRPYGIALANRITERVIPRIAKLANDPKILDLVYTYTNIDPWDEKEQTDLATKQWLADGISRGEYRAALGFAPAGDGTDDMSHSEFVSQYKAVLGVPPPDEGDGDSGSASASRSLVLTAVRKKKR
jgi:hypothetical protein